MLQHRLYLLFWRVFVLNPYFKTSVWIVIPAHGFYLHYVIMCSRLSHIASNQRSLPLAIVCSALSTTELDLLKLKKVFWDLCWLKNERMFSVIKSKVKFG